MDILKVGGFLLIVMFGINVLVTVWAIGKPRKPTTPTAAGVAIFIDAMIMWLLIELVKQA